MPRKAGRGRGGRFTASPTVSVTGNNSNRRVASLSSNGSNKTQQYSTPKQSGRTTKNSSGNRGRKITSARRTPVPKPSGVRGGRKKSGQDPAFYKAEDGTIYRPGDFAYVDSQQPDLPYHICVIKDFKLARKDAVIADVKWFYRVTELPEAVYLLLMEDRKNGENADIYKHPNVRDRELFMAFNKDTHPASLFRGKCSIKNQAELGSKFAEFLDKDDSFFYSYGYKPESRRLTLENEDSYVPGSQQAVLPECVSLDQRSPSYGSTAQPGSQDKQVRAPRETMVWAPQESDEDLLMYLRAARSVALHAGVCMTGMLADGYLAASSDETTQHAFDVLYRNDTNSEAALRDLIKHPVVGRIIGKKNWKKEDALLFSKGMRQFGKNFNKIKAELLPRKEITELVDYYYIWKKTEPGIHSRSTRRQRKQAHIRLMRQLQKSRQPTPEKEFIDWSSCDEDEESGEDREKTKGTSFYACHHCFAVDCSSWHHAGPDKAILCDECRIYYKNYGLMRSLTVKREPPEFLFKDYRESPVAHEGSSSPPAEHNKKRKTRNSNGTRGAGRQGLRSAKSYTVKTESDEDDEAEASESSEGSEYDAPVAVSKPKPLQARRSILEHLDESCRDDVDGPPPPKRQKREQKEGSLSEEEGSVDGNAGSAQKSPNSDGSSGDTSTTSGNDEEGGSPCSTGPPPESNQLPQHVKRVCNDSESSCARTDLVYVREKKPTAETPAFSAPINSSHGGHPSELPTPTANVKVPLITPHAPNLPMGPPSFLNFPQGHPSGVPPSVVPQNPLTETKRENPPNQREFQQHVQQMQAMQMAMLQSQGTPAPHLHPSQARYSLATSVYPVETPSSHHHEPAQQQQHSQPVVFTFPTQEELLRQRMTGQIPGTPEQHQLATMIQQGYPILAGQLDPAAARLQEEQQQHGIVTPQVLIPNVNISMEQYMLLQQQQAGMASGVSPMENAALADFQRFYDATVQRVQKDQTLLQFPHIQHLLHNGQQLMLQLQSLAGQDQHTINIFIQQNLMRIQQEQLIIQTQAQQHEAAQKKLILGRPPENGPSRNSRPSVIAGSK